MNESRKLSRFTNNKFQDCVCELFFCFFFQIFSEEFNFFYLNKIQL